MDELVTAVRHTLTPALSQKISRVFTTGCGDSYFAPLNAELAFEQLAGLPCEVSTELFLDPLLYGPDLTQPCATAAGAPRWFGRGSDWYAFSVLAFRSLTGLHGGTMKLRSKLGAGTVVRVTLPLDASKAKPKVEGRPCSMR